MINLHPIMVVDPRKKEENKRNITQSGSVSVLGIESHVFESHYPEKNLFFL